MKTKLRKIYWFISIQFGVDLRRMYKSLTGIPRYINDLIIFKKKYKGKLSLYPCLYDWYEEGGLTKNEYFWQDLHVARKVYKSKPIKHVDIGSRVDGFIAHVASYREIEVFDIRPITTNIPGVVFKQADLMRHPEMFIDYCDSISCLHALEHFGLGRYGDPIDVLGYLSGLQNIAKLLKSGGTLYLSVPIGVDRVEFNAHRVFSPLVIVQTANGIGLSLSQFAWFSEDKTLNESNQVADDLLKLSKQNYSLGIFTFLKK